MDKFILTLIATFSSIICIAADQEPEIQIFEIRQAREDSDRREEDYRNDYQYYQPDINDLKDKIEHRHRTEDLSKYRNTNVDKVTENLMQKLRRIVLSSNGNSNRNDDDDYIYRYKDLKNDNSFEDNSKIPVVLLTHKDVIYHIIPQQRNMQNRYHPILRSVDGIEDVEDRTAPPRTNIRYDYEYDD